PCTPKRLIVLQPVRSSPILCDPDFPSTPCCGVISVAPRSTSAIGGLPLVGEGRTTAGATATSVCTADRTGETEITVGATASTAGVSGGSADASVCVAGMAVGVVAT